MPRVLFIERALDFFTQLVVSDLKTPSIIGNAKKSLLSCQLARDLDLNQNRPW